MLDTSCSGAGKLCEVMPLIKPGVLRIARALPIALDVQRNGGPYLSAWIKKRYFL
jgi:hypothetical protein